MSRPRVLATVPVYHSVEPTPFHSFLVFSQQTGLDEAAGLYAVRWCVHGPRAKTIAVRNAASYTALAGNATHLLMVDDDMILPPDTLRRLLSHDVDVVSPLFFRAGPVEPLVFELMPDGTPAPMLSYPKGCLFEAPGGTGTGVMLIKAEVLRAMGDTPWVGSVDPEQGEDTNFCKRVRELGFRVWCDSSICVKQMCPGAPVGEEEYEASLDTLGVR